MNLNFVNASTFPGDLLSLVKSIDAGAGVQGPGTGSAFADRLMAVLSPETTRAGQITTAGTMDATDGSNMVLPISGLPFVSSILGAFQVPEQVSTRLIADVKQEGVGIDLDRLIKGLQALQQAAFFSGTGFDLSPRAVGVEQMFKALGLELDQSDTRSLNLGGFVAALEKLRISSAMTAKEETDVQQELGSGAEVLPSILEQLRISPLETPEQRLTLQNDETVADELKIDLDGLIKELHPLESGQSDDKALTLSDFVAALEQLRTASLKIPEQRLILQNGETVADELKIDLDGLIKELHPLESGQSDDKALALSDFVAALEQLRTASLKIPEQRLILQNGETVADELKIDLDGLIKELHPLESGQNGDKALTLSGFLAALEQLRTASLKIPEQRLILQNGETVADELKIDLDGLIKELHPLESGQNGDKAMTLSGFLAALEQLRTASLKIPEQRLILQNGETVADELKIDIDGLIKELHLLESGQSGDKAMTLSGFLTALEQFRTASLEVPEQRLTLRNGETVVDELKIDLDRQIKGLHPLESEQNDDKPLTLSGFVAPLEQLRIFPGATIEAHVDEKAGLKSVAKPGMKINLDPPVTGILDNEKQERSFNVVVPRELVTALEKKGNSTEPDSLDLPRVGSIKQGDIDLLLGSLIASMGRSKGQSMATGDGFKQEKSALGQISTGNPVDLFGSKGDGSSPSLSLQDIQTGVNPEPARFTESVAAVVKEMKTRIDDPRMVEHGVRDDHTAKGPGRTVGAIDASGGAGGEFRQMAMDSRGQGVANGGSTRTVLPSHVTGQVGASLARAVSQGDTEIKLQLKPPELGRIIMTIDNLGTSLKVSVITESHGAKEILAAHANELKAALASSGISIGSFDVAMGSDFSQSMADARHQSKGSGSRRGRNSGHGDQAAGNDSKIDTRGFAGDVRSIHLVA